MEQDPRNIKEVKSATNNKISLIAPALKGVREKI